MRRPTGLLLSALLLLPRTALAGSPPSLAAAGMNGSEGSAKTAQTLIILLVILALLFIVLKWIFLLRKIANYQPIIGPPPPPQNWQPEVADEGGEPPAGLEPAPMSAPPAAANE